MIELLSMVFESADGKRRAISPWTDSQTAAATENHSNPEETTRSPVVATLTEVVFELSELLLNGVRRAGANDAARWKQLAAQLGRVGLVRIGELAAGVADALSKRSEQVDFDVGIPVSRAMNLLMVCRMAEDIPLD
jgi:hypothetical protein